MGLPAALKTVQTSADAAGCREELHSPNDDRPDGPEPSVGHTHGDVCRRASHLFALNGLKPALLFFCSRSIKWDFFQLRRDRKLQNLPTNIFQSVRLTAALET